MLRDSVVEEKAKEIYLAKYGEIGGRWELVETKDVWRAKAREWLRNDEDTEQQARDHGSEP